METFQGLTLEENISFSLPEGKNPPCLTGCCVTETGEFIIADYNNKRLVKTTNEGEPLKNFILPFTPYDVTLVDTSTVAVSSVTEEKVVLVDVHNGKVRKTLYKGAPCGGLCYKDGQFYVCSGPEKTITIMNHHGKIISKITTEDWVEDCCVENDKLYFTEWSTSKVYCTDIHGNVIWKFKFEKHNRLSGIVVDQSANVFVACECWNKVVLIDKSGMKSKVLLTRKDGMEEPNALCFCKLDQSLLVCNKRGNCFIYRLCCKGDA